MRAAGDQALTGEGTRAALVWHPKLGGGWRELELAWASINIVAMCGWTSTECWTIDVTSAGTGCHGARGVSH